ncbi:MAG: hypothetical protein COC13_01505 [Methanobacteriota archaeon]|nr:MAG: hypothetical protein COC13_01505 [Euryarchaeota archaeon]
MARMEFKCPKCKKLNRIVIMGDDSGKFPRTCVGCDSDLEIELTKQGKELRVILISDEINTNVAKVVPKDYKQYEGKVPETSEKTAMVKIISLLIFTAALMGLMTGGLLFTVPDQYDGVEKIMIGIVVKNSTTTLENAIILVDSQEINQTYFGNGSYDIFLKPGKYKIEVRVPLHKNCTMDVYIPLQDNNLTLVEINQGLEGVNQFTFNMQEGEGNTSLGENTYSLMLNWCPGIMFVFSLIGVWGAWVTYILQSYKYAQIGAFFSILAMGFLVVGPILGFIALVLLPKIKNMFNRSF